MGNSFGGIKKKRSAKVMKIDGSTFRVKPPARAGDVLRDHPGRDLLDSDEVKQMGIRAPPLGPEAPLKPGKIYFLVDLPLPPTVAPDDRRRQGPAPPPRRAWSGAHLVHVSAKDRLESLKLARRSVSDLSRTQDGATRLRVRLPRADVAKVMEQSRDSGDAAEKIMELYVAAKGMTTEAAPPPDVVRTASPRRKEKRTRFVEVNA